LKRYHFTLKGLMIAIVMIGVGIAALVRPTKLWAIVLPFLLLTLCLTAILGLVFRRGPKRAFWVGFAVFGWTYFVLILVLSWRFDFVNSGVSFPHAFGESLGIVIGFLMILGLGETAKIANFFAEFASLVTFVDEDSRFLVASSIVGLAFAALGGLIARAFYSWEAASRRMDDSSNTPQRTSDSAPSTPEKPN
jgi:hypothetical protein